jgi:hypothetical protein
VPVEATFGRKWTYRAYGVEGRELGSEDFGSDEEAVAWAKRLAKTDGLTIRRLSRELVAGIGVDIPLP